jgi:hypothetical protein
MKHIILDEKVLRKRLKDKYYEKGYSAAKKGSSKTNDNPYTISDDVRKLLKKRTAWIMGFEEYDLSEHANKIRRKGLKHGKSDVKVYDISHIKSSGKWKEKKNKHKHKHRKHK